MKLTLRRTMILVFVSASVVAFIHRLWPASVTEREAIYLAERFIIANGYTNLPADEARLTPEPIMSSSSRDEELRNRHDTPERNADGAYGWDGGWTIYFRYKSPCHSGPEARRSVVMSANGGYIHLVHQDAY